MMRFFSKHLYLVAFTAFALSIGCGGGDAPEAEPTAEATPEAPAVPANVFEVDPSTAATITGKIAFSGEAPKPRRLNLSADADCTAMHDGPIYDERVVVNENATLKNVFVWVRNGLEDKQFAAPSEKASIDQEGCIYAPHVVGVMIGQTLSVSNSDPTLHNVHPLPRSNVEWNKSQAAGAGTIDETFSKPEMMIPIKCNIHPWMRAYVNVSPHPFFAVTGEDGSFEISGLPPGEYTLEAVHESLGNQTIEVTVGAGESATAEMTFAAK